MTMQELKNKKDFENNMKSEKKVIHCTEQTKNDFMAEMDKAGYMNQNDFLVRLLEEWKKSAEKVDDL